MVAHERGVVEVDQYRPATLVADRVDPARVPDAVEGPTDPHGSVLAVGVGRAGRGIRQPIDGVAGVGAAVGTVDVLERRDVDRRGCDRVSVTRGPVGIDAGPFVRHHREALVVEWIVTGDHRFFGPGRGVVARIVGMGKAEGVTDLVQD